MTKEDYIEQSNDDPVYDCLYKIRLEIESLHIEDEGRLRTLNRALKLAEENFEYDSEGLLKFVKAELLIQRGQVTQALNIYLHNVHIKDRALQYYVYLQLVIIYQDTLSDTEKSLFYSAEYFELNPLCDVVDFQQHYLLYLRYIRVFISLGNYKQAEGLVNSVAKYACMESCYCQLVFLLETKKGHIHEDSEIRLLYNENKSKNAFQQEYLHWLPPLDIEKEGRYLFFAPLSNEEWYAKLLSTDQTPQNELVFDYVSDKLLAISLRHLKRVRKLVKHYDLAVIFHLYFTGKDLPKDKFYVNLFQDRDRWNGDYIHVYQTIRSLSPYLPNTHFLYLSNMPTGLMSIMLLMVLFIISATL